MNGAKLQGFEQSSSAATGSDHNAAAYVSNRGLLVERLQQAVPPQRTPRGPMDIMNSALTSKTNHNDCERSSEAPVDFIERVHLNHQKLTAELPTTAHRGNVKFAVTQAHYQSK
jgi:hypothetical protein